MQKKIILIAVLLAIAILPASGLAMAHRQNYYNYHHHGGYNNYNGGYNDPNNIGYNDNNHYNAPNAGQDYYGPNADNNNSPDNSGDIKANVDTAQSLKCASHDICQATTTNVIGNGNTVIVNNNAGDGKQQQDFGAPY